MQSNCLKLLWLHRPNVMVDQSMIQCIYEYLCITLLLKIIIVCSMYSSVTVLLKNVINCTFVKSI